MWRFTGIERHRRTDLLHDLCDADGTPVDPVSVGMPPDFPRAQRHVVVLADRGGATAVTVTEYGWPEGQMREFSRIGMEQCLAKMAVAVGAATGRTGR